MYDDHLSEKETNYEKDIAKGKIVDIMYTLKK